MKRTSEIFKDKIQLIFVMLIYFEIIYLDLDVTTLYDRFMGKVLKNNLKIPIHMPLITFKE